MVHAHAVCTDCEDCGGVSVVPDVPGAVFVGRTTGRRLGRRSRARRCDLCGHLIRLHALEVAPSADAIAVAPLPADLPDEPTSFDGSSSADTLLDPPDPSDLVLAPKPPATTADPAAVSPTPRRHHR